MARITVNSNKLPIPEKIEKGQCIIASSSGNPRVPGNEAVLAAFVAAQEELARVNGEEMELRAELAAKMTERDNATAKWMERLNGLAAFTVSATGANAGDIASAGFRVRAARTPTQALPAPAKVLARTNAGQGIRSCAGDRCPGRRVISSSGAPIRCRRMVGNSR